MPVGYVTFTDQGLITEANRLATALLGAARNALVRQSLTRFIWPDDVYSYYRHRTQLIETQAPQAFEIRLLRLDGTYFWARLEATAAQDAGGAPVYHAMITDITARVRSEEDRQQAEARLRASEGRYRELAQENARLLAQSRQEAETKTLRLHEVNHRVKNNLAAIIGLLQLDLRYLEAGQQTPYRSLVEDLTSRIQSLALVHTLLSAKRGAPLPLAELAENVMPIAPVMLSRQQPVQLKISPTSVYLAPKQASAGGLILNELATNSLKHAPRPSGPICLYLHTSLPARRWTWNTVTTGQATPNTFCTASVRASGSSSLQPWPNMTWKARSHSATTMAPSPGCALPWPLTFNRSVLRRPLSGRLTREVCAALREAWHHIWGT